MVCHPLPYLCSLGLLPSSIPSYCALKTPQACPHPTLPFCHPWHGFAEVSCRELLLHSKTERLPTGRAGRRETPWAPWKLLLGQEEWWLFSLAAGAESRTSCRGHHVAAWTSGRNCGLTLLCMIPNPWDIAGSFWSFQAGAGHITGRAHGK